jgi:tRNA A-37 threonylcarbamoyl transferase component Bud32
VDRNVANINFATRRAVLKIVYYGPPGAGKSTSIMRLLSSAEPGGRAGRSDPPLQAEPQLYFSYVPPGLATVSGMPTELELWPGPGPRGYPGKPADVLPDTDGIVFVADSDPVARDQNIASLGELGAALLENGRTLADTPLVFQYNKRDLSNAMAMDEMNSDLNPFLLPVFETVAERGEGVAPAIARVSSLAIGKLGDVAGRGDARGRPQAGGARRREAVPGAPAGAGRQDERASPAARPASRVKAPRPRWPLAQMYGIRPFPTQEDLSRDPLLANARKIGGRPVLRRLSLWSVIGEGGMAKAYAAYHEGFDAVVAVKIADPVKVQRDTQYLSMFMREARTQRGVVSRHVVQVYDVGEESGLHFIVQEYVHGASASDFLEYVKQQKRPGLDEEEALTLLAAACKGLADAHEKGVLHRDIKPQNILLSGSKTGNGLDLASAKLADFGLAKSLDSTSLTRTGQTLGTPHYVSPECIGRHSRPRPDQAADVFSAGVALYHLLTHRYPFEGRSIWQILNAICNEPPTPMEAYRSGVSNATRGLVLRCLQKQPRDRYRSGLQLMRAVQKAHVELTGRPIELPAAPGLGPRTSG